MNYQRLPIEIESPEQRGYDNIRYNLTESSYSDARLSDVDLDLGDALLCYGDHRGLPELRALLAEGPLMADDVLVTPGAAFALFILHTALLEKGDRAVVMTPNYATNIETPCLIGVDFHPLTLSFEGRFRIDLDQLDRLVTKGTKLVSLTTPHNPSGVTMSEAELRAAIDICEARGAWLLVDETYRDMRFAGPLPMASTLSERAISVSSLSKTWGLPGLRIGWITTRDAALQEKLLAAKEQIVITNSVVDEVLAMRFLRDRAAHTARVMQVIRRRFALAKAFFEASPYLEWVEPDGGVVAFPRLVDGVVDVEGFHARLNALGTYVGPGHWFGWPDRYMRVGWGWPEDDDLVAGLATLDEAARNC